MSTSSKSLYEVLGVSPTADAKRIKEAFYAKSKELHPDTNPTDPNAPDNFRILAAAYEVLSDAEARKKYDAERIPERRIDARAPFGKSSGQRPPRTVYRHVEVDLSPERMKAAFEAYKARWEQEEENLRKLDEKKKILRSVIDEARKSGYENMTKIERDKLKEDMAMLRTPNKDLSDRIFKDEAMKSDKEKIRTSRMEATSRMNAEEEAKEQKRKWEQVFGKVEGEEMQVKMSFLKRALKRFIGEKSRDESETIRGAARDFVQGESPFDRAKQNTQSGSAKQEHPRVDPLSSNTYTGTNYTKSYFEEGMKNSQETFEAIKTNWKNASFFSDSGGSFQGKPFVPRGMSIDKKVAYGSFAVIIAFVIIQFTYMPNLEDGQPYLQQLVAEREAREKKASAK